MRNAVPRGQIARISGDRISRGKTKEARAKIWTQACAKACMGSRGGWSIGMSIESSVKCRFPQVATYISDQNQLSGFVQLGLLGPLTFAAASVEFLKNKWQYTAVPLEASGQSTLVPKQVPWSCKIPAGQGQLQ